MKTVFFKPKSKILQQYMEGYYFLTHQNTDEPVHYLTFPNNFSIISVLENSEFIYQENKATIQEKPNNKLISNLICHYTKPILLSYIGTINEITFSFKPLGLNAFLKMPLANYTSNFFSEFYPFEDYKERFEIIIKETDVNKKIESIENYWLSKLIGFEHPFLKDVVNNLIDTQNEISISDLAKKYNTSRQNLTKHFELHLCKSPSEFRKIHRFRETLKNTLSKNKNISLTDLTYEMLFYDQSHLIKDFKSLTGLTPKNFFKKITNNTTIGGNWIFV